MRLDVLFSIDTRLDVLFREDDIFAVGFGTVQTITPETDYEELINKPSINGVELVGDKTSDELHIAASFPNDGHVGDILMKTTIESDGVAWVTPASSVEEDNTRPITSAAVYMEIGNINALLSTI